MALFENFPYTNMHNLNLDWIISVIKDFKEQYPDIIEELAKKINKPDNEVINGFLKNLGNGKTEWVNIAGEYTEIIYEAVNEWLDEHPEATTTVQDNSITTEKFVPTLRAEFNNIMSYETIDYYVDPVNGVDASGYGTAALPFKTIQYAYDSMPVMLDKRCTIHLLPGVHNQNYKDMSTNKHPAVLFADNKITLQKTDTRFDNDDNKFITSALEIIGEDGAIIETSETLPYGIYISNYIHLGITNVIFRTDGEHDAEHMMDCNRSSYLHLTRVTIQGGNNCRFGIYIEAGSWAEIAQYNRIEGCTNGIFVNPGCHAVFSGEITNTNVTGISNGGYCYIYDTSVVSAPIYTGTDSFLTIRGKTALDKAVINGKITGETHATIQAIYATLAEIEAADGCVIELLQANTTGSLTISNSQAFLRSVSIDTDSAYAIDAVNSSIVFKGTNNITSAGSPIRATIKTLIFTEAGTTTLESTDASVSAIKLYTQSQSIVASGANLTTTLSTLLEYHPRELTVTTTNCTITSGKIVDDGDCVIFDIIINTTDTGAYINIPMEFARTHYITAFDPYTPNSPTTRICTVSPAGKITPYQNNAISAGSDIAIIGVIVK